ncbi:hypothetical protein SGRIM119S_08460 [Streptomyces griseorubiginosus]
MDKALNCGADVVVIDLEGDAVDPDRKAYAREATAERLGRPPAGARRRPRGPQVDTPWRQRTWGPSPACRASPHLRLPKVTSPAQISRMAESPAKQGRHPSTPSCWSRPWASSGPTTALAHPALRTSLGEAESPGRLGVRHDAGLDWSRSRGDRGGASGGPASAVPQVHPDVRDLEGLKASCRAPPWASSAGRPSTPASSRSSSGPTCPAEEEIEQAESILEAAQAQPGAQALGERHVHRHGKDEPGPSDPVPDPRSLTRRLRHARAPREIPGRPRRRCRPVVRSSSPTRPRPWSRPWPRHPRSRPALHTHSRPSASAFPLVGRSR